MKLHQLQSSHKKSQRIGRGGKRGSYSGRGVKGQRSRSGHRIRPAERDLIIRLPKLRGFRNKPKGEQGIVINLGTLASKLKSYVEGKGPLALNHELLKAMKLIGKNFKGEIKILGEGEITFPVTIHGVKTSGSAKAKIEKAGGKVE